MQSVISEIQADLLKFIRRSNDRILVVISEFDSSALLLKCIEALEDAPDSPDIFLTFGHEFNDQMTFVSVIPPVIQSQIQAVNAELLLQSKDPLKLISDEVMLPGLPPSELLIKLMVEVENIVPVDRQIIWLLFPIKVSDEYEWLKLNEVVLQNLGGESLQRTKVIIRDSEKSLLVIGGFIQQAGVNICYPEMDVQSLERRIAIKAADPLVPIDERAQLHLMLAGFDVTNKRYDIALQRNLELLGYYREAKQLIQQSLVLNNIGDLYYLQNRFSEARTWYENAVCLSVSLESKPIVLYQCMNLGNTHFALHNYDEALTYFSAAEQLAGWSQNAPQQVQALERVGSTHYAVGSNIEAAESWEKAIEISRKFGLSEFLKENLIHLRNLYCEVGNRQRADECDYQLGQLNETESSINRL